MKKWSEIKQATLDKLFLDESEAVQQDALKKFQRLANECLNSIANSVCPKVIQWEIDIVDKDVEIEDDAINTYHTGAVISVPEDFLSFFDSTNYLDGKPAPKIVYLSNRTISLIKTGHYVIFYNAYYPIIKVEDIRNDSKLDIEASILNLLPTYIAWNILSQDDPQRSAILKNEYELLLARIDAQVFFEEKHYKSEGGWY